MYYENQSKILTLAQKLPRSCWFSVQLGLQGKKKCLVCWHVSVTDDNAWL